MRRLEGELKFGFRMNQGAAKMNWIESEETAAMNWNYCLLISRCGFGLFFEKHRKYSNRDNDNHVMDRRESQNEMHEYCHVQTLQQGDVKNIVVRLALLWIQPWPKTCSWRSLLLYPAALLFQSQILNVNPKKRLPMSHHFGSSHVSVYLVTAVYGVNFPLSNTNSIFAPVCVL